MKIKVIAACALTAAVAGVGTVSAVVAAAR